MSTHADICRDGHARATWRKANEVIPDALRDRMILQAIDRCESSPEQLRLMLQQAREDIADGLMDGEGRLTWAWG
jgi:hypothetical protein